MNIITSTPAFEDIGSGKARLLQQFRFSIDGVEYFIPRDFVWDGASIPHLLRWKYGDPFDPVHRVGGLIHDAIYSDFVHYWSRDRIYHGILSLANFTRSEADAIYRRTIRDNGCPWWQSWKEWFGVRVFGGSHWIDRD